MIRWERERERRFVDLKNPNLKIKLKPNNAETLSYLKNNNLSEKMLWLDPEAEDEETRTAHSHRQNIIYYFI